MWNGNTTILKLHGEDFEVLEGDHSEQAIINVYGLPNNKNGPCSSLGTISRQNFHNQSFSP